jgi:ribonuclease BN (tRNA processing enzyme)
VYPPAIQKLHGHFKPTPSMSSLEFDTLSKGAAPNAVKYVIISHAHWDHIHPLPSSFTKCTMIVGPDSSAHYSPGYPHQSESKHDGQIWDPSLRTFPLTELPPTTSTPTSTSTWKLLGMCLLRVFLPQS